jgi:hypothetical protein
VNTYQKLYLNSQNIPKISGAFSLWQEREMIPMKDFIEYLKNNKKPVTRIINEEDLEDPNPDGEKKKKRYTIVDPDLLNKARKEREKLNKLWPNFIKVNVKYNDIYFLNSLDEIASLNPPDYEEYFVLAEFLPPGKNNSAIFYNLDAANPRIYLKQLMIP